MSLSTKIVGLALSFTALSALANPTAVLSTWHHLPTQNSPEYIHWTDLGIVDHDVSFNVVVDAGTYDPQTGSCIPTLNLGQQTWKELAGSHVIKPLNAVRLFEMLGPDYSCVVETYADLEANQVQKVEYEIMTNAERTAYVASAQFLSFNHRPIRLQHQ